LIPPPHTHTALIGFLRLIYLFTHTDTQSLPPAPRAPPPQVTSSAGSDRTFQHVYEFLPLEVPSARSIRKLAAFDGETPTTAAAATAAAAVPWAEVLGLFQTRVGGGTSLGS